MDQIDQDHVVIIGLGFVLMLVSFGWLFIGRRVYRMSDESNDIARVMRGQSKTFAKVFAVMREMNDRILENAMELRDRVDTQVDRLDYRIRGLHDQFDSTWAKGMQEKVKSVEDEMTRKFLSVANLRSSVDKVDRDTAKAVSMMATLETDVKSNFARMDDFYAADKQMWEDVKKRVELVEKGEESLKGQIEDHKIAIFEEAAKRQEIVDDVLAGGAENHRRAEDIRTLIQQLDERISDEVLKRVDQLEDTTRRLDRGQANFDASDKEYEEFKTKCRSAAVTFSERITALETQRHNDVQAFTSRLNALEMRKTFGPIQTTRPNYEFSPEEWAEISRGKACTTCRKVSVAFPLTDNGQCVKCRATEEELKKMETTKESQKKEFQHVIGSQYFVRSTDYPLHPNGIQPIDLNIGTHLYWSDGTSATTLTEPYKRLLRDRANTYEAKKPVNPDDPTGRRTAAIEEVSKESKSLECNHCGKSLTVDTINIHGRCKDCQKFQSSFIAECEKSEIHQRLVVGNPPFNPQNLTHGLYTIYWMDGGASLAAVGSDSAGRRWYAPTNWISGPSFNWAPVKRVELDRSSVPMAAD